MQILGAMDSGKTTLCNIIRGFIPNFFQGEIERKGLLLTERISKNMRWEK